MQSEIVEETVTHIRRLIPAYAKVDDRDLQATVNAAFAAVHTLVDGGDYKDLSLFLDETLNRRQAVGVGFEELRKTVMVFKDVLVGKILFDDSYPEPEMNRLLDQIERLSCEVDERLSVIHAHRAKSGAARPPDPLGGIWRATMESLSLPVLLFSSGDFTVLFANAAMRRFARFDTADDALAILRRFPAGLDRERLERELLTGARVLPQTFDYAGGKCQLFIDRVEFDDDEQNYTVLTLAGSALI